MQEYSLTLQKGSITVQLISCLIGLAATKSFNLFLIHPKHSSWIRTNKTWGQSYSYTAPYEVREYSLDGYI